MSIANTPGCETEYRLRPVGAIDHGSVIDVRSRGKTCAPQSAYYLCGHCSIIFEPDGTEWILSGRVVRCGNCSRYSVLQLGAVSRVDA